MIFYLAFDENENRQLRANQIDIRKVNKTFQDIDIPTDKPGLMAAIQELLTEADEARKDQTGEPEPDPGIMRTVGLSVAGIACTAAETDDGIVLDLASKHDSRCKYCHRLLTATESGAKLLAIGDDMNVIQDMIDSSPDWFRDGLEQAINEEKTRRLRETKSESIPIDTEQTDTSEA